MSDTILEGYLLKKSPTAILTRHPWQRRYFILTNNTLSYYKQHTDVLHNIQPAGIVRHEMIKSIDLCSNKKKRLNLRFNITIIGNRTFELQCSSIEQRKQWMVELNKCIADKPVMKVSDETTIEKEYWRPGYAESQHHHNNLSTAVTTLLHIPTDRTSSISENKQNEAVQHIFQEATQDEQERAEKAAELAAMLDSGTATRTTPLRIDVDNAVASTDPMQTTNLAVTSNTVPPITPRREIQCPVSPRHLSVIQQVPNDSKSITATFDHTAGNLSAVMSKLKPNTVVTHYQKRLFVLYGTCICYYKPYNELPSHKTLCAQILIKHITAVSIQRPNTIMLTMNDTRVYAMKCDTEQIAEQWCHGIVALDSRLAVIEYTPPIKAVTKQNSTETTPTKTNKKLQANSYAGNSADYNGILFTPSKHDIRSNMIANRTPKKRNKFLCCVAAMDDEVDPSRYLPSDRDEIP